MMLKIKNLVCGYNSGFLLNDISLEVEQKEFFGIIGPNGSGKTTLLKTITKLLLPMSGEIVLDGVNIKKMSSKDIAKRIAVVSQNTHMELNMNIEEFVLLGRIPHRKAFQFLESSLGYDTALDVMNLTGILSLKKRILNSLSGGERQLVAIARALAQQPELMLLDEPTLHLDIAHQVQVLELLRRLNRENAVTVIVVLHDLNLAGEYCDRLVLLKEGKIYSMGRPEEVLTYQTLTEVYHTPVVVEKSPISGKPYVIVVSSQKKNEK